MCMTEDLKHEKLQPLVSIECTDDIAPIEAESTKGVYMHQEIMNSNIF